MSTYREILLGRGATCLVGDAPSVCESADRIASADTDPSAEIEARARDIADALYREACAGYSSRQKELCQRCEENLSDCIEKVKTEISSRVVEMSLRIAEIIVKHRLPDRDMMAALIRETLDPMSDMRGVRVRASESVADMILPDNGLKDGAVQVVVDRTLGAGDLVVESRNGIFDARLDERISLLKGKLEERLGHARDNGHTSKN